MQQDSTPLVPVETPSGPFHVPHVPLRGIAHKSCSRCARLKPATREHYHYDRSTWDGLYPRCIACCRETGK